MNKSASRPLKLPPYILWCLLWPKPALSIKLLACQSFNINQLICIRSICWTRPLVDQILDPPTVMSILTSTFSTLKCQKSKGNWTQILFILMIFEDLSITFRWRILSVVPRVFDLITCQCFTWGKFRFKGGERSKIFYNEQIELFQNCNLQIPSIPLQIVETCLVCWPSGVLIYNMDQASTENLPSINFTYRNVAFFYFFILYITQHYTDSNLYHSLLKFKSSWSN